MPHLATYVGLVDHSELVLADSFRVVAEGHVHVADLHHLCLTLAAMSDEHRQRLAPVVERYGEEDLEEPERLRAEGLHQTREGEIGLLRDLQELHVLATLVQTKWTVIVQGAQGLRDNELLEVASSSQADTRRQLTWLTTRMKTTAPQALIVEP
jgi:hypothetical protein